MGIVVDGVAECLEVFVFDDACEGDGGGGVVDDGVALIVGGVEGFGVEADGAIFEFAEAVAVEFVDFTGEYDLVGNGFPVPTVGKEVGVETQVYSVEQPVDQAVIAADGYALIEIVEVVVVEG